MNESSSLFSIIDSTLAREDNKLSVAELCSIAWVSRSGYYAWKKAEPLRTAREAQDRKDFELILSVYKRRGYAKGGAFHSNGIDSSKSSGCYESEENPPADESVSSHVSSTKSESL